MKKRYTLLLMLFVLIFLSSCKHKAPSWVSASHFGMLLLWETISSLVVAYVLLLLLLLVFQRREDTLTLPPYVKIHFAFVMLIALVLPWLLPKDWLGVDGTRFFFFPQLFFSLFGTLLLGLLYKVKGTLGKRKRNERRVFVSVLFLVVLVYHLAVLNVEVMPQIPGLMFYMIKASFIVFPFLVAWRVVFYS